MISLLTWKTLAVIWWWDELTSVNARTKGIAKQF